MADVSTRVSAAHKCFAGWTHILPTIRRDTSAALRAYGARHGVAPPRYAPRDYPIYDRCEIFRHPIHGPYGFSLYDAIPCAHDVRVLYIRSKHHAPCEVPSQQPYRTRPGGGSVRTWDRATLGS